MKPFVYFMKYLINFVSEFLVVMIGYNEACISVSSANSIGMDLSDILLDKSFIYIRNSNGPSTEPCGAPC
jgi:hypothetical protein